MYVWAVEQKQRFEKQDVFVLWSPSPPSCSWGDPCAKGIQKSVLQEFFRKLALNQPCLKLDGTLELHRKGRRRGEKKKNDMHSVRKISEMVLVLKMTWLSMVDQWHQKEIIRYCNYMFQLSLPNRNEKVEKSFVWLSETHSQLFFLHCKQSSENTASFEMAVKPVLPTSCCFKAFRSCYSELGQATIHLPVAADTIHDCSTGVTWFHIRKNYLTWFHTRKY